MLFMEKEKLTRLKNDVQIGLMTMSCAMTLAPAFVSADESAIAQSLWSVANKVLGVAQSILFPVLAIMTVFFGIKIFIASDAKTVNEAKTNAIRCGVGALIVLFAPTLVQTIEEALNSAGSDKTFNH